MNPRFYKWGFFCFILTFISCKTDKPKINSNKEIEKKLLLVRAYEKEQELEFFQTTADSIFSVLKIKIREQLPLGKFNVDFSDSILIIDFPNEFYAKKINAGFSFINEPDTIISIPEIHQTNMVHTNALHHIFIYPSRPDNNGYFKPCIRCPKWMNEVYVASHLDWLENFHLKNK